MSSNLNNEPARIGPRSFRFLAGLAFTVGAMLLSGIASAAAADMSEAKARYQKELAACISGQSHQDRATCLQEAGAAMQEARRGTSAAG